MPPTSLSSAAKSLRNRGLDLRDMLLTAGVGQYNATLAIPYMNFLPSTTEPYAQGTRLIVQGLQRMLNQRGARLAVDGGFGVKTIRALIAYAGPRWPEKSWAQLYADVIEGQVWPGYVRNARGNDRPPAAWTNPVTGLGDPVTDLITNPLVLAAGGFFVWWKFFRKPTQGTP